MALDHLNLSRAAVAQRVGVDKSAVARWTAGTVRPAEHSLVAITDLVRAQVPAFCRSDWALPDGDFAARLGVNPAAPARDEGPLAATFARAGASRTEAARYAGLWAVLYASMQAQPGQLRVFGTAIEIMEEAGDYRCLTGDGTGGAWIGEGVVLPLGGKLYLIAGREPDHDALTVFQFWGVPLGVPTVLDGLCMAPTANLHATPTATYAAAFRLCAEAPNAVTARERWSRASEHMGVLCQTDLAARLPSALLAHFRREAAAAASPESRRVDVPMLHSLACDARHTRIEATPASRAQAGLAILGALFAPVLVA